MMAQHWLNSDPQQSLTQNQAVIRFLCQDVDGTLLGWSLFLILHMYKVKIYKLLVTGHTGILKYCFLDNIVIMCNFLSLECFL